jgi:hypothetical protein
MGRADWKAANRGVLLIISTHFIAIVHISVWFLQNLGMISRKGGTNMNQTDLEKCRNRDILSCNPDDLVDLQDVHIDTSRPVRERMEDYLKQVGNPYLFKVDGLIVKAVYLPNAKDRLCDALPRC